MGNIQTWACQRWPFAQSTNEWITGEERLTKRVKWLYKCNDISFFTIFAAHVWSRRRSYYLAETTGLVKEAVIGGRLVKTPDYTAPPRCYWLGSYPIYWDGKRDGVTYAHVKADGPRWPLGKKPSHPSFDSWTPTREQISERVATTPLDWEKRVPLLTDPRLVDKVKEWAMLYELRYKIKPPQSEFIRMSHFFGIKLDPVPPSPSPQYIGLTPDPGWVSLGKQQDTIDNMDRLIADCVKKNYTDKPRET